MIPRLQRLRLVVRVDGELASVLQQRCSAWFHGVFRTQLTHCLGSYIERRRGAPPVALDTLRLNLGEIPLGQFEQELSRRSLDALMRELMLHDVLSADASVQPDQLPAATSRTVAPRRCAAPHDALALLVDYLDTGRMRLPEYWLAPASPDTWLVDQLDGWSAIEPGRQRRVGIELAWRCVGETGRRRLMMTFGRPVLARLGRWLLTGVANVEAAVLSDEQACNWLPLVAVLALQCDGATGATLRRRGRYAGWRVTSSGAAADATRKGIAYGAWRNHEDHLVDGWPQVRPTQSVAAVQVDANTVELEDTRLSVFQLLLEQRLTAAARFALRIVLTSWAPLAHPANPDARLWRSALAWVAGVDRQKGVQSGVGQGPLHSTGRTHPASEARRTGALAQVLHASARIPFSWPGSSAISTLPDDIEYLPVISAGILLLWPALPSLFESLLLTEDDHFVDAHSQRRAVMILDALAWGGGGAFAEWRLSGARLWCGLPESDEILDPVVWPTIDADTLAQVDAWLVRLIAQVPSMNGFDVMGFRALFLQRRGVLAIEAKPLRLTLELEVQDILLRDWPWPVSHVSLPWLSHVVSVDWLIK
ncbi:contractile injection system tape measure protein, partial [Burkholderia ambifaria]|uniref:contractile injection system tape measure protein n=1 Tax=Burkholderia ambifaria TaxID=152480 RepID=UPI000AB7DD4C